MNAGNDNVIKGAEGANGAGQANALQNYARMIFHDAGTIENARLKFYADPKLGQKAWAEMVVYGIKNGLYEAGTAQEREEAVNLANGLLRGWSMNPVALSLRPLSGGIGTEEQGVDAQYNRLKQLTGRAKEWDVDLGMALLTDDALEAKLALDREETPEQEWRTAETALDNLRAIGYRTNADWERNKHVTLGREFSPEEFSRTAFGAGFFAGENEVVHLETAQDFAGFPIVGRDDPGFDVERATWHEGSDGEEGRMGYYTLAKEDGDEQIAIPITSGRMVLTSRAELSRRVREERFTDAVGAEANKDYRDLVAGRIGDGLTEGGKAWLRQHTPDGAGRFASGFTSRGGVSNFLSFEGANAFRKLTQKDKELIEGIVQLRSPRNDVGSFLATAGEALMSSANRIATESTRGAEFMWRYFSTSREDIGKMLASESVRDTMNALGAYRYQYDPNDAVLRYTSIAADSVPDTLLFAGAGGKAVSLGKLGVVAARAAGAGARVQQAVGAVLTNSPRLGFAMATLGGYERRINDYVLRAKDDPHFAESVRKAHWSALGMGAVETAAEFVPVRLAGKWVERGAEGVGKALSSGSYRAAAKAWANYISRNTVSLAANEAVQEAGQEMFVALIDGLVNSAVDYEAKNGTLDGWTEAVPLDKISEDVGRTVLPAVVSSLALTAGTAGTSGAGVGLAIHERVAQIKAFNTARNAGLKAAQIVRTSREAKGVHMPAYDLTIEVETRANVARLKQRLGRELTDDELLAAQVSARERVAFDDMKQLYNQWVSESDAVRRDGMLSALGLSEYDKANLVSAFDALFAYRAGAQFGEQVANVAGSLSASLRSVGLEAEVETREDGSTLLRFVGVDAPATEIRFVQQVQDPDAEAHAAQGVAPDGVFIRAADGTEVNATQPVNAVIEIQQQSQSGSTFLLGHELAHNLLDVLRRTGTLTPEMDVALTGRFKDKDGAFDEEAFADAFGAELRNAFTLQEEERIAKAPKTKVGRILRALSDTVRGWAHAALAFRRAQENAQSSQGTPSSVLDAFLQQQGAGEMGYNGGAQGENRKEEARDEDGGGSAYSGRDGGVSGETSETLDGTVPGRQKDGEALGDSSPEGVSAVGEGGAKEGTSGGEPHRFHRAARYASQGGASRFGTFGGNVKRDGQDVTPSDFNEVFGFKNTLFAELPRDSEGEINWELKWPLKTWRRRFAQEDINQFFDELVSFCDTMGIPYQALSLGGVLEFGSLNLDAIEELEDVSPEDLESSRYDRTVSASGKRARHKIHVIEDSNLIRSSFAHEWFHALDHLLLLGKDYNADEVGAYEVSLVNGELTTEGGVSPFIRMEVLEALREVVEAVQGGTFQAYAKAVDDEDIDAGRRDEEYWSTPVELAARAFEAYLAHKHGDLQEIEERFEEAWTDTHPYSGDAETTRIFQAFDNLFSTLRVGINESTGKQTLYHLSGQAAPRFSETQEGKVAVAEVFDAMTEGMWDLISDPTARSQRKGVKKQQDVTTEKGFAKEVNVRMGQFGRAGGKRLQEVKKNLSAEQWQDVLATVFEVGHRFDVWHEEGGLLDASMRRRVADYLQDIIRNRATMLGRRAYMAGRNFAWRLAREEHSEVLRSLSEKRAKERKGLREDIARLEGDLRDIGREHSELETQAERLQERVNYLSDVIDALNTDKADLRARMHEAVRAERVRQARKDAVRREVGVTGKQLKDVLGLDVAEEVRRIAYSEEDILEGVGRLISEIDDGFEAWVRYERPDLAEGLGKGAYTAQGNRAYAQTLGDVLKMLGRSLAYGRTRESVLTVSDAVRGVGRDRARNTLEGKLARVVSDLRRSHGKGLLKAFDREMRRAFAEAGKRLEAKPPTAVRRFRAEWEKTVDALRRAMALSLDAPKTKEGTPAPEGTPGKVEERIYELQAAIDKASSGKMDEEGGTERLRRMATELMFLQRYGGIAHMENPVEAYTLMQEAVAFIRDGLFKHVTEWERAYVLAKGLKDALASGLEPASGNPKRGTGFVAWAVPSLFDKLKWPLKNRESREAVNVLEREFSRAASFEAKWNREDFIRICGMAADAYGLEGDGDARSKAGYEKWMALVSERKPHWASTLSLNGRTLSRANLIYIYASLRQDDVYKEMAPQYAKWAVKDIDANGKEVVLKEGIDAYLALLEGELDAGDIALAEMAVKFFADKREPLSSVSERVIGVPVYAPVEHYIPLRVEADVDMTEGKVRQFMLLPNFLKQRVRHNRQIDESESLYGILVGRSRQQNRWMAYADLYLLTRETLGDPEVNARMNNALGSINMRSLNKQIQDVFAGLEMTTSDMTKFTRTTTATIGLGFNFLSAARQLEGLAAWGIDFGVGDTAGALYRAFADLATEEGRARFMREYRSEILTARMDTGNSLDMQQAIATIGGLTDTGKPLGPNAIAARLAFQAYTRKAFAMIKHTDAFVCALGMTGLRPLLEEKWRRIGYSAEEARELADRDLDIGIQRVQQSGRPEYLSALQRAGFLGSLMSMFTGPSALRAGIWFSAANDVHKGLKQGDRALLSKGMNRLAAAHLCALFYAMLNNLVTLLFRPLGDDKEDERLKQMLWETLFVTLTGPFAGLAVLGPMANTAVRNVSRWLATDGKKKSNVRYFFDTTAVSFPAVDTFIRAGFNFFEETKTFAESDFDVEDVVRYFLGGVLGTVSPGGKQAEAVLEKVGALEERD